MSNIPAIRQPSRRAAPGILLLVLCTVLPALGSEPTTVASFGPLLQIEDTMGDIWTPTWAADDTLYVVQDDSELPDGSLANLAVSRLDGNDPRQLSYSVVNPMKEYGKMAEAFGVEGGTWKAAGIISIDGVLYVSLSRVLFASIDKATGRIETIDASIIKSTDGGKSWARTAAQNLEHPMFPGNRFSNPVFIQYGKNASAKAHGSDRYIYAVSSDGPWSHADHLILGRVLRSKLGNLKGSDWEFYQGGGRDGTRDREWSHDVGRATPVLSDPQNLGWTNVAYVPQRNRYLMGQWYWEKGRWHNGDCTWVVREARTPWGPWTTVTTKVWNRYHDYYFPVFVPKFVSDDGHQLYLFTTDRSRLGVIPMVLQ